MAKGEVMELGSLWASTAPSIAKAEEDRKKEQQRKNIILMNQNQNTFIYADLNNDRENNMDEIFAILKKSGLKKDFPFKPVRDRETGEVSFVPKGKNPKEIEKNILEYKEQMRQALEAGKITEEEYNKLEENLDDLMIENDIQLEEEKEIEVTDQEILDNIKTFIVHNYGEKDEFAKECKNYQNLDLNDRKFKLQDINSKINSQLGIAGELHFAKDKNLKFENSFFNGGYYLTEDEVMKKGLANCLYTMMEKSMIRQKEQEIGKQITPEQKRLMHKRILQEKMDREKERKRIQEREQKKIDSKNLQHARSRVMNNF